MTEKKINAPYDNPFGIWHVTTEGDCEGRSPRDLGFHEGYIDEIALALADKCFYSLYFVAINIHSLDITPTRKTVDVTFGVNSGTWAMTPKECVTAIKEVKIEIRGWRVTTISLHPLWGTCMSLLTSMRISLVMTRKRSLAGLWTVCRSFPMTGSFSMRARKRSKD